MLATKRMSRNSKIRFYIGCAILLTVLFFSVFSNFLMKYPYDLPNLDYVWCRPCSKYFLGTDNLGRDIYSRIIFGVKESLIIAIIVEAFTLPIGLFLGFICGYKKSIYNKLILNTAELFYAFPTIILALLAAVIMGPGKIAIIVSITLGSWPYFFRKSRSLVIKLKDELFIKASETMGASTFHIFKKHILPNVIPIIVPDIILDISGTIMCESTLSFMGIGIQSPVPSLGNMISDGLPYMNTHPLLVIISSSVLGLVTLGLTFVGDSLSEVGSS